MFAITNSADAKGADCLLEAFCLFKQGFKVSGQVGFPALCSCSSPFFYTKLTRGGCCHPGVSVCLVRGGVLVSRVVLRRGLNRVSKMSFVREF